MELKSASTEYKFIWKPLNIWVQISKWILASISDGNFSMVTTYVFSTSPTAGCSEQLKQVDLMGCPFIVFQQTISMNLVLKDFSSLQCHRISRIAFSWQRPSCTYNFWISLFWQN